MSINNQLENFWNTLTGQNQEDARTKATNEANLAQVESTNQANRDIAHETNEANLAIARENLGYQRELQEYNKALQQQIFEREDTSYQRTAKDMLAAGLNPLSMQGTNGAGEAIAMSPLENTAQMQTGAPMQAAQFQKSQTMSSPLQSILNMVSASTSVAGAIGQLSQLGVQRDLLTQQAEKQRLENIVFAKKHDIQGSEVLNPFGWDDNQKREYNHKVKAGKYDSDSTAEKTATAILEAANGRYTDAVDSAVDKAKNKVRESVPLVDEAIKAAEQDSREQTMQARAKEKGYILRHGRTSATIVPHIFKKYNTVKIYDMKGNLVDQYDMDYDGNILYGGTKKSKNNTSNKKGKF